MQRTVLGPVGGAQYRVDRPDWRRAGHVITARIGLAVLLAAAITAALVALPWITTWAPLVVGR